jgi:hypothetical protein
MRKHFSTGPISRCPGRLAPIKVITDSSGPTFGIFKNISREIKRDRIMFPADAPQLPIWQAMASLATAFTELDGDFEKRLFHLANSDTERPLAESST